MNARPRFALLGLVVTLAGSAGAQQVPIDRKILPVPEPSYPAITEMDARRATAPPRFEVRAPTAAPNVVIVLIDDMGFGTSSAFGGPASMPTLERLALRLVGDRHDAEDIAQDAALAI